MKKALAFGAVMMASSTMNNLFVTFYLSLFINHSKLSPSLFYLGQFLYLLWNSFNDPCFGFLQDFTAKTRLQAFNTRIRILRYGGIAWTLAFLAVWFPPEQQSHPLLSGIHFVASICFYDAFLTLIELSHGALLSEITTDSVERARLNAYSATLAGIGSFSSFIGQSVWNAHSLENFQYSMIGISLFCAIIFVWSSFILNEGIAPKILVEEEEQTNLQTSGGERNNNNTTRSVRTFIRELLAQHNFLVFTFISSIQSFDCAFEKSSFAMFLLKLTESYTTVRERAVIVSASFFVPWLITLGLTPVIQKLGIHKVLLAIFFVRLAFCGIALKTPNQEAIAPFLLINRVLSELVCRLSPLVLSDIVDEDRYLHKRSNEARAGSVVGFSHFFPKIFSSLGPMASFALLTWDASNEVLRMTFIMIPFTCVMMQIFLWRYKFTLKGSYLKKVKKYVNDEKSMVNINV